MLLQADNLRSATRIAANGKPEAMQLDDRSHQAQAKAQPLGPPALV
jgi:hypothetical protein